jgi:hypothetical protein
MSTCFYGDHLADPDEPSTGRRVVGIEVKAYDPSRRGGSDIIHREPTGEFVCGRCIERLRMGLSVHQDSLL